MAGVGSSVSRTRVGELFKKWGDQIIGHLKYMDINQTVNDLPGVFTVSEQLELSSATDRGNQASVCFQILQDKSDDAKWEFIHYLHKHNPDLPLKEYLTDSTKDASTADVTFSPAIQTNNQSLQLSLQLALKERDNSLRESAKIAEEKEDLLKKMEQLRVERDRAIESLNGELAEKNFELGVEMNGHLDDSGGLDIPEKLGLIESEIIDTGTDKVIWETHRVTIERIPGFGFGIAVSGGKDNPHFSNGDPSIAISDVLKAGPAENKLQINDRVLSVNGFSLDTVEHSEAIAMLKDSGNQVELVVKRKLLVPNPLDAQPTKVVLQKRNKRDDYGIILGCKFYVKEIVSNSLAAFDGAIKEGDTILKINNISVESISLQDARRQVEKAKEKLQLTLKKPPRAPSVTNLLHKRQNSDLDYTKFQPYKTDNMYLINSSQHDKGDYEKPSINTYVRSTEHLLSPSSHYKRPDQSTLPISPLVNGESSASHTLSAATNSLYYESRDCFGGETRYTSYNKEGGGAGLRIAGGNHTGIYIAGVQDASPAQREGIREGDEIIKIDGQPTRGMTREEAVLKIMNLQERVDLVLQNRIMEFRRVLASTGADSGDLFHIRTHMVYDAPKGSNHMSYKPGDLFKVTDTLRNAVIGEWTVAKLDSQYEDLARGVIPNKGRAESLRRPKDDRDKPGRGSIFRRKSQKRSKSLGRDHWEDVVFAKETSKYEAYERVVLREPGFMRPVVIYGGVSDIAQERLLREVPDLFEAPPSSADGQEDEVSKSGIVKLGSIRAVIDVGKHCVLDVVPSAVDKLNYAQYYPIVINLKTDKKELIKDLRTKWSSSSAKNSRKLFEQSLKVEKSYPQIFTKEIDLNAHQDWFTQLRETIAKEQVKAVWMSEYKPTENMADDFLFPMANRLSYMASPESDLETSRTSEQLYAASTLDRNMTRASSDPNIGADESETPAVLLQPPPPSPYSRTDTSTVVPAEDPYGVTGSKSLYTSNRPSHYAPGHTSGHHRVPRDRMLSDSRVHYHSAPFNGYNSVDRHLKTGSLSSSGAGSSRGSAGRHKSHSTEHKAESDHSGSSGGNRPSHYMSPRGTKAPHDPYKFTRMSSQGGYTKPAPPVRSDSMGSSSESPYGHSRISPHRRVNHSVSLDQANSDDPKLRNYENSSRLSYHDSYNPYAAVGRTRRPSGPTSNYLHPQSPTSAGPPNGFMHSTPTGRSSRSNGHYATPQLMSQSLPADDSVFHATPISVPPPPLSSFTNQLYMDSKEASTVVGSAQSTNQEPNRTSASFENYKKFVSNTPFYGAKRGEYKKEHFRKKSSSVNDSEPASAFESYRKSSHPPTATPSGIEIEPTPENHILLDTVSGVFDSAGGVLSSEATGVSIYLPPNAIPNGVNQEIYFKVCKQDNSLVTSLDKEKGETLLSPLVMCGPQGLKFQLPVELRLPHVAAQSSDSWTFSLKSANDATTAEKENNWQTQDLGNIPASPSVHASQSNSVSVLVDQF